MSNAAECRVTGEPLDPGALLRDAADPADGAVLLFVGVVREHNEGRTVVHLDYEAYIPMAEAKLREICLEAQARWRTGRICAVHRVGRLAIGEPSVVIAVAAPHRGDAYEASRYVIEEVKRRIPVWKREGYLDGASEWLAGVSLGGEPR